MNIIILDLEWNSAYCPQEGRFINEILEFGAVKLDKKLREIGRFQCIVRSSLTNRLRSMVKDLTNITNDDMRHGLPLDAAMKKFTEWAGKCNVFTWSDSDLHVLIENCNVLLGLKTVPFLYRYGDLQKYVMAKLKITGNQISLSAAAEKTGVDFSQYQKHRALGDSLCCAEILRKIGLDRSVESCLRDTTKPDFYHRFLFKPYPISTLNSEFVNRKELYARCPNCRKKGKQQSKWHYKNRNFSATFFCSHCNRFFIGKVRFKKTYDTVEVFHCSLEKANAKEGGKQQ